MGKYNNKMSLHLCLLIKSISFSPFQHLVSEGAGTSYQTMDPAQQQETTPATDGEGEATGAESAPTSGDERGAHKMSAFTSFLGFLTKQSYIVGLVLMMVNLSPSFHL